MSFGHGGPTSGPAGHPPQDNNPPQQGDYTPSPYGNPPSQPGPYTPSPQPHPYAGPGDPQHSTPNPYLSDPPQQSQPPRQPAAPMPPVQLVHNEPDRPPHGQAPHGRPPLGQPPHGRPPSTSGPTPDWSALADAAASRTRRKRLLYIGGGVLATLAVGALVATAVVSTGRSTSSDGKNSALPSPETLPTESAPAPTFSPVAPPPPPDPKDFISSAEKDRAPLNANTLFPGKSLTLEGRSYAKGATNQTTNCAAATQGALGGILTRNGCDQVIRATFHKGGAAVTVGVAVFKTEAQALKAKNQVKDGIASLPGAGVPTFCRNGTICRKTANSYGRYAYFTVAGFTDNKKNVTTGDKAVFALGDDTAKYTFLRIVERGRTQASAAASAPTLNS